MPKRNSHSWPPWFNQEIIATIKAKDACHRLYRKRNTDYYRNLFKLYRSRCKHLIKASYKEYIHRIENNISTDPKSFWAFVQSKKGGTRIPGVMHFNDSQLTSPEEIVNAFGEYFNSVYIASNDDICPSFAFDKSSQLFVSIDSLTENDVFLALKKSKNSCTAGLDGIPSFLLSDCACIFAHPLLKIFNLILKQCKMPDCWKKTCICPVFKAGDVSDVDKYRPISLLCNFAKTFETVLYKYIYSAVKSHITEYQHGFYQGRSTITNLACFSQYVSVCLDNRGQVDTIYTDFRKAFDQIDHYVLIAKLQQFGFSTPLINFFRSYLTNRVQVVKYRNFYSQPFSPTSGVPQGSNLGPLLFLLFVNDIVDGLSCEKLLYADDLKLFMEIKNINDSVTLQANIQIILQWCIRNRLSLNQDKCFVVSYTRKLNPSIFPYTIANTELHRCDNFKDLGITFDSKFNFVKHIDDVIAKSFRMYGFVYRNCSEFSNIKTLCNLYFALIRSRLEYGAIIWYPLYDVHVKNIEAVQRKFLKFLCYCVDKVYPERGCDHAALLGRFEFLALQDRRNIIVIKFVFNLFNNKIDCPSLLDKFNLVVPRINSRQFQTFYSPAYKTNVLRKSPVVVMCNKLNEISTHCDIHYDSLSVIIKSFSCIEHNETFVLVKK